MGFWVEMQLRRSTEVSWQRWWLQIRCRTKRRNTCVQELRLLISVRQWVLALFCLVLDILTFTARGSLSPYSQRRERVFPFQACPSGLNDYFIWVQGSWAFWMSSMKCQMTSYGWLKFGNIKGLDHSTIWKRIPKTEMLEFWAALI